MIGRYQPLCSSIVKQEEEHANGSIEHHHHNPSPSDASKCMANNDFIAQDGWAEKKEAQMPSELITSCVATWIMIQVMEKLLGSITHPKTESNCIVIVRHWTLLSRDLQMCTERQYPPADVAQLMDTAVTSLQPRCPQNLPIYREIQMCMGRIKTQIMSLVPSWKCQFTWVSVFFFFLSH